MGSEAGAGMDQKFSATELLLDGFLLHMDPISQKFPQAPKNRQLLGSYRFF